MPTQVIMPQLGESVVEGAVGRWLIAEGQPVKEYEPLLTVTTDKVDTEIPAPASGILLKVLVGEGQTVAVGAVLALIGEAGEAAAPAAAGGAAAGRGSPATPLAQRMAADRGLDIAQIPGTGSGGRVTRQDVEAYAAAGGPAAEPASRAGRSVGFLSPAVARLAAELDVDLAHVIGTGAGGRITKKDVLAYVAAPVPRGEQASAAALPAAALPAAGLPAAQLPAWEQPGSGSLFKPTEAARAEELPEGEVVPLSPVRRSIAKHMVLSKHTSPHATTVMEADMTRVARARARLRAEYERQGVKLTFTPFFVQAAVAGLKAVPEANSTLVEDSLLLHKRIHIGLAVAVADGLIVPVIRDADEKSLLGLARAVNDLSERSRSKRLAPADVQGGTFTLTNHGTSGSLFATPIINQPQAGILGVGAIQKRAVVLSGGDPLLPDADDTIAIRPMVYLSFTFDHRILDGQRADSFLMAVKRYLEDYAG